MDEKDEKISTSEEQARDLKRKMETGLVLWYDKKNIVVFLFKESNRNTDLEEKNNTTEKIIQKKQLEYL